MKAELMALALLFAFVGFINSQLGPGVDDEAAESIAFLSNALQSNALLSDYELNGASEPWMNPLWKPSPTVQAMLFGLQAAIGCVMVAYFLRHKKKSIDPEWD